MTTKPAMRHEHNKPYRGSYTSYVMGFILSAVLTIASYVVVSTHTNSDHQSLSHGTIVPLLAVFALTQLVVQLVFFLHIAAESRPRWRLMTLLFAVLVVVLLVGGSLWVMYNLDYNMSSQHDVYEYLQDQEDL